MSLKYKLALLIIVLIALMSVSFVSVSAADATYEIDTTNLNNGSVSVYFTSPSTAIFKLKISKGETNVYYTLQNGLRDTFSLTLGNGSYTIKILENTVDSKYKTVYKKDVSMNVTNEQSVYLNSIQNINWNDNMDSVDYANQIVYETVESLLQKVRIYELIIFNYSYDDNKYANVKNAYYLPIIDETFHTQMGICYDFSSLLAGMLRSQGVPTKLVKGYADYSDVYHAWNEVYINGKWYVIDTTYDAYYVKKGVETTMLKSLAGYNKLYEY